MARWLPYALIAGVSVLWIGVAGIGLNGDDYQYLHSLAPMRGAQDLLRPWMEYDMNPHYFRPLANTTMVADFLLFGWDGGAFHITNLLFHIVASLLVYGVGIRVFRLTRLQSLFAALLFSILASHEYNLVVDTARADVLVTIFSLTSMLYVERWCTSSRFTDLALAVLSFGLALASKELAFVMLPVFAWQFLRSRGVRSAISPLLPFAVLAAAFLLYHQHFTTTSIGSNDVVQGASLPSVLRNAVFSLGYLFVPVEQETALGLIHRPMWIDALAAIAIAIAAIAFQRMDRRQLRSLAFPLFFLLVTGVSAWLVFERWRLYLPSVGVVMAIAIVGSAMFRGRLTRVLLFVLGVAFVGFHVTRAISAQTEWRRSTAMMDAMKHDFTAILADEPHRPLNLVLVTVPAKLGSAGVMVLGWEALAQQAEAERLRGVTLNDGKVDTSSVKVDGALQVYALDPSVGFEGLSVAQVGAHTFSVSAPRASGIHLVPAAAGLTAVRRELTLTAGDTLSNIVITRYESTASDETIEFALRDTTALPVIFDGNHLHLAR